MDNKERPAGNYGPAPAPDSFTVSGAREVLATLHGLDPGPKEKVALIASLRTFEQQLEQLESLHSMQAMLAQEYGISAALPPGCVAAASSLYPSKDATGDAGDVVHGQGQDAHGGPVSIDIFSIADGLLEREHVLALAWQGNCSQEVVRRELRAFQKVVSDRISLATRRAKLPYKPPVPPPPPAGAAGSKAGPADRASRGAATAATVAGPSLLQPSAALHLAPLGGAGAGGQLLNGGGGGSGNEQAFVYCLDEDEEAVRRVQLAKLGTLLVQETGGIAGTPVSVVGVFQQLMASCCPDWRVRSALLGAMGRTPLDVLWRLLQNSRVLDTLHAWLQDALSGGQVSMLRLLLGTMGCLPMRRDLLKGSKLEAALEGLAGGGSSGGAGGQPIGGGGGDGAAADEAAAQAAGMRRRFGATAAAVLEEWRRDPDPATILRRAGAPVPEALLNGRSSASASASAAATATSSAAPPGSRLLGSAAAAEAARKRALGTATLAAPAAAATAMGRAAAGTAQHPGDARGAPRPRLAEQDAGMGGGGSGGGGGARRLGLAQQSTVADMTAKLGEKGPLDTDVVLGFRSRQGDGSVRRSQLARPQRAAATTAAAAAAPPSTAAAGGGGAAPGRAGALQAAPLPRRPSGGAVAAAAAAGTAAAQEREREPELDAEAVARLRAQRAAQRQAAGLAALQAEARRQPEVAEAEAAHRQRQEAYAAECARMRRHEKLAWAPDVVSGRLAALRESVPWDGPPPALRLPPGATPLGEGEESVERHERARDRLATPKVAYPGPQLVPSCPDEAAAAAEAAAQAAAAVPPPLARPFPWCPSLEAEDGPLDWWRQNLVAWEAGVRLADYALPPALLHRYLELDPKLLPPKYAGAPAPPRPAPAAHGPPAPQAPVRPHDLPPPPLAVTAQAAVGPQGMPLPPPPPIVMRTHPPPVAVAEGRGARPTVLAAASPAFGPQAQLPPPPQASVPLPPPPPLPQHASPEHYHHNDRQLSGGHGRASQATTYHAYGEPYGGGGGHPGPAQTAMSYQRYSLEQDRRHQQQWQQPYLKDGGRAQPDPPYMHGGHDPQHHAGFRHAPYPGQPRSPGSQGANYDASNGYGDGGRYVPLRQHGSSPPPRGYRGRR